MVTKIEHTTGPLPLYVTGTRPRDNVSDFQNLGSVIAATRRLATVCLFLTLESC